MSEKPKEKKSGKGGKGGKARIHLLDELRGVALCVMLIYHALYTLGFIFGWRPGADIINTVYPIGPYFAGIFIAVAGICSNFSHSNTDRGAKLFFLAFIVSAATYFVVGSENAIRFGILHFMSVSMLFYGVTSPLLKHIPLWIGFAVNVILFILTIDVVRGSVGIPYLWSIQLPAELYKTDFLYPLGFIYPGFTSSDYFPLFPWIFLYLAGCFFGRLAVQKKFPKFTYKKHVPFLALMGRHSLIIYLVHQPIIYGICYIVTQVFKVKLG